MARVTAAERDKSLEKIEGTFKALRKELIARSELRDSIRRTSENSITIPERMTIKEAANVLANYDKKMLEAEDRQIRFDGHAHDILVAIRDAVEEMFGEIMAEESFGFFSRIPGQTISVPIAFGKSTKVPHGLISIPGMEDVLQINVDFNHNTKEPMKGRVTVIFRYQRLYAPLIDDIEKAIQNRVANYSIFQGKSINSMWEFLDLRTKMTKKLVYSEFVEREINAHVLSVINNLDWLVEDGQQIRRTILLSGKFGTGKTLTALAVAQYANERGWTFYLLSPGDSITSALEFAKRQQPCVVFMEDVDTIASAKSTDLDKVMIAVDGATSKEDKILLLLTTNYPDRIANGMFRPGRIDHEINMNHVDPQAVRRLVLTYAGSMIDGPLSEEALWESGHDYAPAFIAGSVTSARLYAIADGRKLITNDDVVAAFEGMRPQWNRMNGMVAEDDKTVDNAFRNLLDDNAKKEADVLDELRGLIEDVQGDVEEIKNHVV